MPRCAQLEELIDIDARKICVIKPSAFGDVVQSLPILRALRTRFPRASISWIVNDYLAPLLQDHAGVDDVIRYKRQGKWGDTANLLSNLRRSQFDLVFDLQGLLRTGIMTLATGARWRIGLENYREGAHRAYTHVLPDTGREVPAHARYWRVAEAFGVGDCAREADIAIGDADREWAGRQLVGLDRPIMAINAGSRWDTKRWSIQSFSAVARRAVAELDHSLVILGSPDERSLADILTSLVASAGHSRRVVNLAGQTSLGQLAAVLEYSDYLLTNDSGPMHLAAALQTPVVGIFTCTTPSRSGPPGDQHELVTTNVSCHGSYKKRCPQWGDRYMCCMNELDTARVWGGIVRLLEKNRQLAVA